ncbi:MAG: FAD-dependent oxidoreductase [Hyphomicrobiales bacterium]|nr:FAD-dependent oxidoreductase [Hyphomicrobiales bacterium]MBV8825899.1 FAD-dependent oxidoreductase [Hyphomicrobiales bacterium]
MKPISRRAFLAASASAVAAPAVAGTRQQPGMLDAIIVGAGAAGIAAGRRLAAANKRFLIVEAAERIGGRCFTETQTFGAPYDRGAHAVHTPDINPVAKLAARAGLEVYPAPGGEKLRIGRRDARTNELEDYLATIVRANRAIGDVARAGKADVAAAQALPKDLGDLRPSVEFYLGPHTCAKDLAEISAFDLARSAERDVDGFCRQGFGALVTRLAQGLPVQLATAVSNIDVNRRGVELRTSKGYLTARGAIVTASTGVLNAGKIRFEPELPRRYGEALGKLTLGHYEQVALEFPGNPFGLQSDDLIFEKASGPRTAALLANASGGSLSLVRIGGTFARDLAREGEDAMVAFALEWMTSLFGSQAKQAVKRTHATQWAKEPWVLGGFSAAAPGGQPGRRALMEPVRDRLFFAGEAVHETQWGTVGGAWESGERAADALIRRIGR